MKTPEEIFSELLFENRVHCYMSNPTRLLIIEAMKRFGFQCWLESIRPYMDEQEEERRAFNRYLQGLYLGKISKQAQDNGEYK